MHDADPAPHFVALFEMLDAVIDANDYANPSLARDGRVPARAILAYFSDGAPQTESLPNAG